MTPRSSQWPFAALLLLLLPGRVSAANDQVVSRFTYPDIEGLTFYATSSIVVTWVADFDSAYMLLWCAVGNNYDTRKNITDLGGKSSYELKIDFNLDPEPGRCWLNLKNGANSDGMNSPNFKLIATTQIRTTFSLSKATSTTKTTSSAISSSSNAASEISSSSATPSNSADAAATTTVAQAASSETSSSKSGGSSGGLNGGQIAGIVVGIVGALVVGGLGVYFWRRRKKAAQTEAMQYGEWEDANKNSDSQPSELPGPTPALEIDSRNNPRELPG